MTKIQVKLLSVYTTCQRQEQDSNQCNKHNGNDLMTALENSISKHILFRMESMEWRDSNSQFVKINARTIHYDSYETIGAGSCSFIPRMKNVCVNIQHEGQ